MTGAPREVTPAEFVRRLIRSRTWHLYQAGAARRRLADVAEDVRAHERTAADIDARIRDIAAGEDGAGGGDGAA